MKMKSIIGEMLKTENAAVAKAKKELMVLETDHADVVYGKSVSALAPKVAGIIEEKRREYFELARIVGQWNVYFRTHPERTMFLWASDYVHETDRGGEGHRTLVQLAKELKVDKNTALYKWASMMSPKDFAEKIGPIAYRRPQPVGTKGPAQKSGRVIKSGRFFLDGKTAVAGA